MDEALRPQMATKQRVSVNSPNWLFEPFWAGDRLLARIRDGGVTLTDAKGTEVTGRFREVADVLSAAVDADAAVLDGVWSVQPFLGAGSAAERWSEALAANAQDESEPVPLPAELETRRAFVALDILELDGGSLRDLPYQERRRLLASVVVEGAQVRLSPAVKVPLASWLHAWELNGFTYCVAKHVNSRYLPGEPNPDWIIMPIKVDAASALTSLFWRSRRTEREVTD